MSESTNRKDTPALAGLELCKLERMHDGENFFFFGVLNPTTVVLVKRAQGVSDRGRELWSLSLGKRRLPRPGTAPAAEG